MNYQSFLSVLPEPLRQPGRLGLIASLGFHGLLFGFMPFLPISKAEDSERVVNLVQLSQAEQSRLPGSVNPSGPTSFFDVPAIELPDDLPPVSNLPPLNEIPPGWTAIPQLPEQLPQFNPNQRSQIAVQPFDRPLPTVPRPQTATPIPAPSAPSSPEAPSPAPYGTSEPTLPNLESGTALPDTVNPEDFQVGSEIGPLDEFAQGPSADQDPAQENTNPTPAEIQEWYARVQTRTQDPEPAPPKEQELTSLPYPQAACEGKYEGTAVVGAVVDPDGQLVAEGEQGLTANPELLESSGYPVLNQAAIAAVQGFSSYAASGKYQTYIFRIPYRYSEEDCAEASTPQPSPTPNSSPSPGPSPRISPKPSPQSSPSPSPSPTAESEASPSPSPTVAEPTPEPTPTATASVPAAPEPAPSVAPEPAPEPSPEPEPEPEPTPTASEEPLLPPLEPFQPSPSPDAES